MHNLGGTEDLGEEELSAERAFDGLGDPILVVGPDTMPVKEKRKAR